ncbi:MAG: YafY family transcriptional regulator [Acidobacteria bacterium]|nr:YafY family transcriptional regulator [Acidobacteriota bacterium]
MNRTDRLLAMVLELQRKGKRRAEDLAATFAITRRTVYRDIQALCEAGVPVVALPGQGYTLMDGYFLPPLSFSTDEATMLLFGCAFIAEHFDSQYKQAAQSARRKIEAVLSDKRRAEVGYLQNSIAVVAMGVREGEGETLRLIRRAVIESKRLRFVYHTRFSQDGSSQHNRREADPYGLVNFIGSWYLVAYCHLRKALRNFRLDRCSEINILDTGFTRPANFTLEEIAPDDQRQLIIRALFDPEIADWVKEAKSFFIDEMHDTADGLLVTLRVRTENEVVNWLLSWGGKVKVLEPRSMQERLIREARKILQNLETAKSR